MNAIAIELEDVGKDFVLYHGRPESMGERFRGLIYSNLRQRREHFTALDGISLKVNFGEALGLLGHNGSGKTTLLQIIAGILKPSRGRVAVSGRISPLIQLGVGFHDELTGLENLFLNASVFGFRNAEIAKRVEAIVAFAELEKFIDTPLKHYSTGMQTRLAFSIAVHLDPQILLADEVLAVGDQKFQERCYARMTELQRNGMTLVLVSHSKEQVSRSCDRYVRLECGRIIEEGKI